MIDTIGSITGTIATLGGFAPGVAGPIPAPLFALLLTLLFCCWFLVPEFQRALLSLPLPALVGVNAFRLGGVFFLILTADGRLSAPWLAAQAGERNQGHESVCRR